MSAEADSGGPRLLTYKQAMAELGGISKTHLYRMIRAGDITPVRLGPRTPRVSAAELDELIKRRLAAAQAEAPAA